MGKILKPLTDREERRYYDFEMGLCKTGGETLRKLARNTPAPFMEWFLPYYSYNGDLRVIGRILGGVFNSELSGRKYKGL
jgi:hypothetical protein